MYRQRLEELAAVCGLPPSSFVRRFRRVTGHAPIAFLHRWRCAQAAALLVHGGRSVLDAALAVGYADPSGLHRQFTAIYGCSPRAWRRRAGGTSTPFNS